MKNTIKKYTLSKVLLSGTLAGLVGIAVGLLIASQELRIADDWPTVTLVVVAVLLAPALFHLLWNRFVRK